MTKGTKPAWRLDLINCLNNWQYFKVDKNLITVALCRLVSPGAFYVSGVYFKPFCCNSLLVIIKTMINNPN